MELQNKIYCGDSLELIKQIPDKSIDLVYTDPPYLLPYSTSDTIISLKILHTKAIWYLTRF